MIRLSYFLTGSSGAGSSKATKDSKSVATKKTTAKKKPKVGGSKSAQALKKLTEAAKLQRRKNALAKKFSLLKKPKK